MEERWRMLAARVSRVGVWMRFATAFPAFPMLPAILSGAKQPAFLLGLHARKHLTASIYNVSLLNQASAEEVCTGVHVCSDSFHTRVGIASLRAPQIGSDIHREERSLEQPIRTPWSSCTQHQQNLLTRSRERRPFLTQKLKKKKKSFPGKFSKFP